jgi:hypothetical protein
MVVMFFSFNFGNTYLQVPSVPNCQPILDREHKSSLIMLFFFFFFYFFVYLFVLPTRIAFSVVILNRKILAQIYFIKTSTVTISIYRTKIFTDT